MASVTWMGAEAVLMFHKLVIVFGHVRRDVLSIIAWGIENYCIVVKYLQNIKQVQVRKCFIIIYWQVFVHVAKITLLYSGLLHGGKILQFVTWRQNSSALQHINKCTCFSHLDFAVN